MDQENDTSASGESERNALETVDFVPSSTPSAGFTFTESVGYIINPIYFQGSINNLNIYSMPRPVECIEFNVEECIPSFYGREGFIKNMHEDLVASTNSASKIRSKAIVICGLGGVGKTQVVRKYIRDYKACYDHVLWINAESHNTITSNFVQLAQKIRIDVNQDGTPKPDENILEDVYDLVCQKFALVVFDNVEPSQDDRDGLPWFFPQAVKTTWNVPTIILTSRNRSWMHFRVQELTVFDLNESLSLLSSLRFRDCEDNRVLLEEVVKICQGLPLALHQAVAFVRNKQDSRAALHAEPYNLKDFLTDVAIKRKLFLKTRPRGVKYPDLFTLYNMTFYHIGSMKHGQLALDCLDVMAILNPDNIPTILIQKILNCRIDKLAESLNILIKFNIVTRCDGFYQMHRMVQAAQNESSKEANDRFAYVRQNVYSIMNSVQELLQNLPTNFENKHELLHNVLRIHNKFSHSWTEQFFRFQVIFANKLEDVGSYSTAVEIYLTALQRSRTLFGIDHSETIDCKENFGTVSLLQGNYGIAESVLNDVIQIRTKLSGSTHPATLTTKTKLANVLRAQGKYTEAIVLYIDILEKQVEILGPNHSETLNTKYNLALVLNNQGKFEEARELFHDVLQRQNTILGPQHQDTLTTKNNLAFVLCKEGKFKEARELYTDVLEMQNRIMGLDHPGTLTTQHNLAVVLCKEGKFKEARELYTEVLEIQKRIIGLDHPATLTTKNNLAFVLGKEGKFEEARELHNDVLHSRNKSLGPDHPDTLTTKNNLQLALVLCNQDKFEEARELYNDVLQKRNGLLGPEHPDTLATQNNLAGVFYAQGKYDDALNLYKNVQEMQHDILGPYHPDTLTTKNNVAGVFHAQRKFEEAIELFNDVLQMRNEILGPNHPETLTAKNNLAAVLKSQGKFEEAGELFKDVLQMQSTILGPNHPGTLPTKNNLALAFSAQRKFEEARELFNDVLQIRNALFGPEHPDTLNTKNNIAGVFYDQEKYEDARKLYSDVLKIRAKVLGHNHPQTLNTKFKLASISLMVKIGKVQES